MHHFLRIHINKAAQAKIAAETAQAQDAKPPVLSSECKLVIPRPAPRACSNSLEPLLMPDVVDTVSGFLSVNDRTSVARLSRKMDAVWTPALARGLTDEVLQEWQALACCIAAYLEGQHVSPELRATVYQSLGWWSEAENARRGLLPSGREDQLRQLVSIAVRDGRPQEALDYASRLSTLGVSTRGFCAMAWVLKGSAHSAQLALDGDPHPSVDLMILHLRNQPFGGAALKTCDAVEPYSLSDNWQGALLALRRAIAVDLDGMQRRGLPPSEAKISASLPLSHFVVDALIDNPHFARVIERAMQFRDEYRRAAQQGSSQQPRPQ
jgi:hypothetical protein